MVKRICLVSSGLAGGGMERAIVSLANFFAGEGHEVSILNLFRTDVCFDLRPTINLIWPSLDRSSMHRMVYALRLLPYLRKNVAKVRPDVVLSFGEWFNSYVILALAGTGQRLFVSNRMGPMLKLGFPVDQANRLLYRFASGIIAQTNIAKEILQTQTGAKKIYVIPNAVKPIQVAAVNGSRKRIITIGRLSREKGHSVLIKAFAQMATPDWMLDIVGDGPLRKDLEAMTDELGLAQRVVFHGYRKDIAEHLAQASIFVLPSFYEGFPNALVEAMSVPLACIASNCVAGPSDIIQDGVDGLLVPTGEVGELTSSLDRLASDPDYRSLISKNAYAVRERFSFEKMAAKYLDALGCGS
jgi:glycosyltransferase involved in cell wall biosynthesis